MMSNDLEARVAKLEAAVFKGGADSPKDLRFLNDEQLAKPWANKEIKRDPKFWKGESFVGRRYSECPPEYLEKMADSLEYRAAKEAAEVPVKLQTSGKNAGRPWHESTSFEARICKSWAAKKRFVGSADSLDDSLPGDSEEIPF